MSYSTELADTIVPENLFEKSEEQENQEKDSEQIEEEEEKEEKSLDISIPTNEENQEKLEEDCELKSENHETMESTEVEPHTILADEIQQHLNIEKPQNNNENETIIEEKPQIPKNGQKSGIRPPTAVLRQVPAKPLTPRETRPSTTTSSPSTKLTPSPRKLESRERSDLSKSTSTKSIDTVGKFTPKMNAKFVNVRSKVGSITNHKPGGGNVEIFSEKKEYKASSKVGSMANANHVAGGGNVRIENRRLDFSNASPKIASKTNYVPAKSDIKVVSEKLNWNARSKVGSLDNANHKPTGGNVQILNQKLNWKAESKVGSKDNIKHQPGGGNIKIFDEKIRYVSRDSSRNHSTIDISSL